MSGSTMVGAAVPPTSDSEYSQDSSIVVHTARSLTKAEKIKCTVQEISNSEADYFKTFMYLKIYERTLHNTKMVQPAMLKTLIPRVLQNIQKLSADCVRDFTQIAANWTEDSCIGHKFLEMIPHLNIYKPYVRDYDKRTQALLLLRKNSKFVAFEAENLKQNVPPLESLLMAPVQRSPKYMLLLEKLLKYTSPDHPDYDNLTRALKLLMGTLESINFSMKDWEERHKVLEIDLAFGGAIDLKTNPARRLLMRSKLYKIGTKRSWYHFLLFNDMLLYATGREDKLTLKKKLELPKCQLALEDLEDLVRVDKKFAMNLQSTDKSFIVCAESQKVKDQWLAAMDRLHKIHHAEKQREDQATPTVKVSEMLRRGTYLPVMQSKGQTSTCTDCTQPFGMWRRKQNCSRCGRVFCKSCLKNTVQSPTTRKRGQICNHCNQIQTHVRRRSQVELMDILLQAGVKAVGSQDEVMELACQIQSTQSDHVQHAKRQPERKRSLFSWSTAVPQDLPPKRGPELLQRQKSQPPQQEESKEEEEMVLPLASPAVSSINSLPEAETDDDDFEPFCVGEIYYIKDDPCQVSSIKNGQAKLISGISGRKITLDATKSTTEAIREYERSVDDAKIEKELASEKEMETVERAQRATQKMLDARTPIHEEMARTILEQKKQIDWLTEQNEAATVREAGLREVIDLVHQTAPEGDQDKTKTLTNAIQELTSTVREQRVQIEAQNSALEQQALEIERLKAALGDLMISCGGEHFVQTSSRRDSERV